MNDDQIFQPDLGNIEKTVDTVSEDVFEISEEAMNVPSGFSNQNEEEFHPTLGSSNGTIDCMLRTYECPKCHTSFSTASSSVTYCVYCGANGVTATGEKSLSEYYAIPFSKTFEDAYSVYKKKASKNPLIPFSFHNKNVKNRIRRLYVPATLFNIIVEGNVTFLGADKINNVKGSPMQTFESLYDTHFDYLNVLSSNYSVVPDDIMSNLGNMNYSVLKEFNSIPLNDSFFINENIDRSRTSEVVQQKILKYCVSIVRGNVKHELRKLSTNNMVLGISSSVPVFIPIYLISFNYKGKEYFFIMNGQTGESIVEFPICSSSIAVFSIIAFIVIFLLCCLIAHFM